MPGESQHPQKPMYVKKSSVSVLSAAHLQSPRLEAEEMASVETEDKLFSKATDSLASSASA